MRLTASFLVAALLSTAEPAPPNYDESKVPPYTLPDPLVCADGTPVRDVKTWQTRRRPELLELFAREVYGRTPAGRPKDMHWETTSVDRRALGGKATRKEITVWFTVKKDGPQMHLLVYQPNGAGAPWPVFLGLNYFGNQCVNADPGITLSRAWMRTSADAHVVANRATEATRGFHASRWNIEEVIARGYATATVYYGDLCPDNDHGIEEAIGAMFRTGSVNERAPEAWGSIGIWAWGLSRALDCLEGDGEVDAKRVAVHGHSRLGKTALWAGAQDERFALVISNDSGAGGAALAKRIYGETVGISNSRHSTPWYALNYRKYNDNESAMPVDQHELLALIAPRPLHVGSAADDRGADPKGEFLSVKAAEPVFRLFGKKGLGVAETPAADQPALGDGLAYHVRSGGHDITLYDWKQYLDFADRNLKRKR
ncbi:MAG TPA: acetylxylan esterase [Opitutaceae bacterium]|nr:acetylxylan esterase [Opitutaceae bacterium]